MKIHYEESFGTNTPASNVLEDGKTDQYDHDLSMANYWLGVMNQNSEFIIKLKCKTMIRGVIIRNGQNFYKSWGTKKFSLYLALQADGPWTKVLTDTLEDPRSLSPVPKTNHKFNIAKKGYFIKFRSEEFYGRGPAIQFFDVLSNYYEKTYFAISALAAANCDTYTFQTKNVDFR